MPYYIPDYVSKTTCIGNTLSTFNTSFSNLDTRLFQLSTYTVNSINFLSSTMISVSSVLDSRINFLSSTMISVSSELNNRINFLSSSMISVSSELNNRINFLSSSMISVSSDLNNKINFLSSSIISVSGNLTTLIDTTSSNLRTQINYISANAVNNYITQGVLTNVAGQINWNFATVGTNAKLDLFSNARLNNPTGLLAGQTGNLIVDIGTSARSITSFGNLWTFGSVSSAFTTTLSAKNLISYYYDGEQLLSNLVKF